MSVNRIIADCVVILTLSLLALPPAWSADPAPSASAASQQIREDKPGKGMSMHRVKQRYGEPLKTLEARGKPPITRWVYKEFTVYFEGRYVIHAVMNHKRGPLPDEQSGANE